MMRTKKDGRKGAEVATKKEFEELYRKHYTTVYYTALQLMGAKSDAEDMTQDAFITAFMKYGELQDTEAFGAWVKRIVINKCLDELRKKRPVPTEDIETELMGEKEDDEYFLQEEYIINDEKRAIIFQIMKSVLSKKQFETVFLFYYDELTVTEIAKLLDVPEGTVLSRLSVSRAKIKKGVLEYEKKNHDKLYGLIMVPFLTRLFTVDAEAYTPPDEIPPAILKGISPDTPDISVAANAAKKGLVISSKAKLVLSIAVAVTVLSAGGLAIKTALDEKPKDPYEDEDLSDKTGETADQNGEDDGDDENDNPAGSSADGNEDDGRLVLQKGDLTIEEFPDYDNDGKFCGVLRVYTNHTDQDLLLKISHKGSTTAETEYVPAKKTDCHMCYAVGEDIYSSEDMNIQEIAYPTDPAKEYVQKDEYKLDVAPSDYGLNLVQEYVGSDAEPFEQYSTNFYFVFFDEFDDVMDVEVANFPSSSVITAGHKTAGYIHFFNKELLDYDHYSVYFHSDRKQRNEIGYANSLHVRESSSFTPIHGNDEKEMFEVINTSEVPLEGCFSAIGYIGDEIACTTRFLHTNVVEAKSTTYISEKPDIWMKDVSLEQVERWEIYPCYVKEVNTESGYACDLSSQIQADVEEKRAGTYHITLTNQADMNADVSYYIFFYDADNRPISVYGGSQDLNAGGERAITIYLEDEESSRIDHYQVLIRGIYDD